jgi:hypothetical protein
VVRLLRVQDIEHSPSPRVALWFPIGILWLLAGVPVAVWTAMFVHAVRASRFLGRWPRPGYPDPKALPVSLQSERVEGWIGGAVVALVICIGIQSTRHYGWKGRYIAAAVGLAVLWTGWFVISRVDPGGVVAWYLH